MCGPTVDCSKLLDEVLELYTGPDNPIEENNLDIFKEKAEDTIDIQVADNDIESMCCQRFLDFFENYLIPDYIIPMANRWPKTADKQLRRVYEWLDNWSDEDCKKFIALFQKMEQDGVESGFPMTETRDIGSAWFQWQVLKKCLSGEEFDYTDYDVILPHQRRKIQNESSANE
jgi:hypothetical protein